MKDLTTQEQNRVRAVIRFLRREMRGWEPLAKAVAFQSDSLGKVLRGGRSVTPTLAFRIARLVKVPVDDLLAGKYLPPGVCPHCGNTIDAN